MARELLWFSNDEPVLDINDFPQIKYFSVAQDLKMEQRPIKQRYRLLINEYSRFVQVKKASLKPNEIDILDQMLISKFNVLINQVEEAIQAGRNLSVELGITDINLRKAADQFSREYRKLLKARDTLGYIPKMNQQKVDDYYKLLIAELRKKVFGPVMNLFSWDPNDLPKVEGDEELEKDTVDVLNNGAMTLAQLYDYIVGTFKSGNINAKVELLNDPDRIEIKQNYEY